MVLNKRQYMNVLSTKVKLFSLRHVIDANNLECRKIALVKDITYQSTL